MSIHILQRWQCWKDTSIKKSSQILQNIWIHVYGALSNIRWRKSQWQRWLFTTYLFFISYTFMLFISYTTTHLECIIPNLQQGHRIFISTRFMIISYDWIEIINLNKMLCKHCVSKTHCILMINNSTIIYKLSTCMCSTTHLW